jgi:hypothetical protein
MKTQANLPQAAEEGALKGFLRGWDRFWFAPTDPITLCLMRLCVGLVVLYLHIAYCFDLLSYVGRDQAWLDGKIITIVRYEWPAVGPAADWFAPNQVVGHGQYTWSVFFHMGDPVWIYTFHICFLVVIVMFALGLWTRITSVLVWAGAIGYVHRAPTTLFGMDVMMMILLFYLMIGPSGATLSLDRLLEYWRERRRRGPGYVLPPLAPSVTANFIIRLVQIHFCFIYAASGLSKLLGSSWWGGTALWATFANYSFAPVHVPIYRWCLEFLTQHRLLWELVMEGGVAFTLFTEIGLPFLIWVPRWRWFMIICSTLLHLGIGLFMGLVCFSLFMLCLLSSFLPPETVRHLLRGVLEQGQKVLQPRPGKGSPKSRPVPVGAGR